VINVEVIAYLFGKAVSNGGTSIDVDGKGLMRICKHAVIGGTYSKYSCW
jgi:hypothetical protein